MVLEREKIEKNVLEDESKQLEGIRDFENGEIQVRQKTMEQCRNWMGRKQTAEWQMTENYKHGRMRADNSSVHVHMWQRLLFSSDLILMHRLEFERYSKKGKYMFFNYP